MIRISWQRILFVISAFLLALVLLRGIQRFDDTSVYLSAMQQIQGKTPLYPESQYITAVIPLLNNPATIVLSAGLGKIVGSELTGLAIVNAFGYLIAVYFFYLLAQLVFRDEEKAGGTPLSFLAALFLASNYSLLKFGPGAYLVDMPGWLWYIVALYCGVRFFYKREERFAYLAGFFSMIGLFFKEYGGIGILTLIPLIFFTDLSWRQKIILSIKSGSFLLINVGYHILMYFERGYLYFNRYQTVITDFAPNQTIIRTIKVLGSLYLVGWPLAAWGVLVSWNERMSQRNKVFIAMLPSALIFFAYPAYDQRISFIAVPLLSLLTALGLSKIRSRLLVYSVVVVYIVSNFFMDWIMWHFSLDAILNIV